MAASHDPCLRYAVENTKAPEDLIYLFLEKEFSVEKERIKNEENIRDRPLYALLYLSRNLSKMPEEQKEKSIENVPQKYRKLLLKAIILAEAVETAKASQEYMHVLKLQDQASASC